jgi:hypothetical protein
VPTLVNSIRSLSNPYHATWNQGGAAFAKSVRAGYQRQCGGVLQDARGVGTKNRFQ